MPPLDDTGQQTAPIDYFAHITNPPTEQAPQPADYFAHIGPAGTKNDPLIPKTQADIDRAAPGSYIQSPKGTFVKPHPKPEEAPAIDQTTGEELDFSGLEPAPTGPSALGAAARGAVRGVLPAAGGMVGFGAGAEAGAALGAFGGPAAPLTVPAGALVGGLAGGFLGGYGAGEAQEAALSHIPEAAKAYIGQSDEQRRADIEAHPYAAQIGEIAPNLAAMRPGAVAGAVGEGAGAVQRLMAHPVTARTVGAGLMGGQEAATEAAQGEPVDWGKVGIAAGAGALMNRQTALGERLTELGASPVRRITGTAAPSAPGASPASPATTPAAAAPPAGAPAVGERVGISGYPDGVHGMTVTGYGDGFIRFQRDDGTPEILTPSDFARLRAEPPQAAAPAEASPAAPHAEPTSTAAHAATPQDEAAAQQRAAIEAAVPPTTPEAAEVAGQAAEVAAESAAEPVGAAAETTLEPVQRGVSHETPAEQAGTTPMWIPDEEAQQIAREYGIPTQGVTKEEFFDAYNRRLVESGVIGGQIPFHANPENDAAFRESQKRLGLTFDDWLKAARERREAEEAQTIEAVPAPPEQTTPAFTEHAIRAPGEVQPHTPVPAERGPSFERPAEPPVAEEPEAVEVPTAPQAAPKARPEPPISEAPAPEAPQPEAASAYGASNKVFTQDAAERAREILRQRLSGSQLSAGVDPELMQAGITLAGYHIEAGARKFADFSQAMLGDLGEAIRPYLRSFYEGVRHWPEFQAAREMSDPGEVEAHLAAEAQHGVQDTLPPGDAGARPEDVHGAAPVGETGPAPPAEDDGGARSPGPDLEQPPEPEPAAAPGGGGTGVRDTDNLPAEGRPEAGVPGATGRPAEPSGEPGPPAPEPPTAPPDAQVKGTNYRIEPGTVEEGRTPRLKARDNIAAIELANRLVAEGRPATREEQQILAKYVGWGGLSGAFPDPVTGAFRKGLEDIGGRLKDVLTPEQYRTAAQSTQYAHYTSEPVIRNMWDAVSRLGFKGGAVFEPGMGIGHFLGMMPPDLTENSHYQGIELDHLTAQIARLLYPESGVRQADFTRTAMPENVFDLAIGNPPFGDITIKADPKYAPRGFLLHDYFFAKSLDSVRPGGLLAFVTSAGTMNKLDDAARRYMAERAEFVGGIRLPSTAFKRNAGTEVTTDVLFFKKHPFGPVDLGEEGVPDWTQTVVRTLPDTTGTPIEGNVSQYFSQHPEQVLGEEGFFDKLYKGRYGVHETPGTDLHERMQEAITRLPQNIMEDAPTPEQKAALDFSGAERKDGSFYLKDGTLMQYSGGAGRPVERFGAGVKGGYTPQEMETVRQLIPIRDALRDVFRGDLAGDAALSARGRESLNRFYDEFVAKNGPINKAEYTYRRPSIIQAERARAEAREEARERGEVFDEGDFDPAPLLGRKAKLQEIARARADARERAQKTGRTFNEGSFDPDAMADIVITKRPNIDPFSDDQESYRLRAIEDFNDKTGEAQKRRIFFESTLTRYQEPEIKSANDGILWSINKLGKLDIDAIAGKLGTDRDQVIRDLGDAVMRVPGTDETYQTRDQYLSGDVVSKLDEAKAAAERDPYFQRNVEALQKAQPIPLSPAEISVNLGMPWIPVDTVRGFVEHLGIGDTNIQYSPVLGKWLVDVKNADYGPRRAEWSTPDVPAHQLLSDALNRKPAKVLRTDKGPPQVTYTDPVATQAAQEKMDRIKQEFAEWAGRDPALSDKLAGIYNEKFNRVVLRKWDGSYLTTPGVSTDWSWRPHQTRVVARIIQEGNTYMAHAVGAGKTSAMIGAGMEMRRLGLIAKPMYVVPNHMLGQFAKEFYEQYPTARIRVADDHNFHTDRRKQFVADVAQQDIDGVIITNSAFNRVPISKEFGDQLINEEIDNLDQAMSELGQDPDDLKKISRKAQEHRITVKQLQKRKERLQQRLAGIGGNQDAVNTFEELGTDFLFVDEAHQFRKLPFVTQTPMKGISPEGSDMAWDLYTKIRYLDANRPGRSIVMASGTPVTNTMGELYTLSRYMQPQALADRSVSHFDSWAQSFGDTHTSLEQTAQGTYEPVTRFSKFVNMPELYKMVGQIMDVVTPNELAQYVKRPDVAGGGRELHLAPRTPFLDAQQRQLAARVEAIRRRRGPPSKGDDILLSVINDGRLLAMDPRFIDPSLPNDPSSKLNQMIANVHRIWGETKDQPFYDPATGQEIMRGPATQMVFSNMGIQSVDQEGRPKFSGYNWMRREWTRLGIPPDQIAFIKDYPTPLAKQQLFNDVNAGKVRILVGSTAKMGTGVNAQRRLVALHNLDPLWYPADDEQRVGRGLRQGNLNKELQIHDYSTKGTYDSTMWGMMGRKGRFIEQFFRGDPNLREMEDLGEASQYEQASAIATSDERVIRLTEMRQELQKIERRQLAHESEQYTARRESKNEAASERYYHDLVGQADAAIQQHQEAGGIGAKDFRMTVGDEELTDRQEAAKAIENAVEQQYPNLAPGQESRVGSIGGHALVLSDEGVYRSGQKEKSNFPRFLLDMGKGIQPQLGGSTGAGVIQSAIATLRQLPERRAMYEARRSEAATRAESYRSQLGKEFTEVGKIQPLRDQIAALEDQIKTPQGQDPPTEHAEDPQSPLRRLLGEETGGAPLPDFFYRGTREERRAALDAVHDTDRSNFIDHAKDLLNHAKQTTGTAVRQYLLDDLAGLEAQEKSVGGGKLLPAAISPSSSARLARNAAAVADFVVRHGQVRYNAESGLTEQIPGAQSLVDILKPIADLGQQAVDDFKLWAIAMRANRLRAEGRENKVPDETIDKYRDLDNAYGMPDGSNPFLRAHAELKEYNRNLLDFGEATGIINPESRALFQHDEYVPFFRALDDDTVKGPGPGGKGIANMRSPIKRLKGGTSKINDVFENMVMNTSAMIRRGMNNQAMRLTVQQLSGTEALTPLSKAARVELETPEARQRLSDLGLDPDTMSDKAKEAARGLFGALAKHDPNVVSVMDNGKPQFYQVNDPLLLRSLVALGPATVDGLTRILSAPARLLRGAVVFDPAFMLAHNLRMAGHSYVLTGTSPYASITHAVQMAKGLDPVALKMMAAGAVSGRYDVDLPRSVRMQIEGGDYQNSLIRNAASAWKFLKLLSEAGTRAADLGPRTALYERAIRQGATDAEAIRQARDLLDFSTHGDGAIPRFLTQTIPFLNARWQGLARTGRGLLGEDRNAIMMRAALVTGATIALWYENHNDPRWQRLEDWDKQYAWHFWVGDLHFRLPKPFEIGAVTGSLPEIILDYFDKNAPGGGSMRQVQNAAASLFLNIFKFNPIPAGIKPALETYFNTDSYTGRPIVNEAEAARVPDLQYGPTTSPSVVALTHAYNAVSPAPVSPEIVQHLLRGYLAGWEGYITAATDALGETAGWLPKQAAWGGSDIPVVNRFVREYPEAGNRIQTDFYDLKKTVSQVGHSIKSASENGDQETAARLMRQHPEYSPALDKSMQHTGLALAKERKVLQATLMNPGISAEAKRRSLDQFYITRDQQMDRIVPMLRRAQGLSPNP